MAPGVLNHTVTTVDVARGVVMLSKCPSRGTFVQISIENLYSIHRGKPVSTPTSSYKTQHRTMGVSSMKGSCETPFPTASFCVGGMGVPPWGHASYSGEGVGKKATPILQC